MATTKIYEHLLTEARVRELRAEELDRVQTEDLQLADSHERIARHVAREVERALSAIEGEKAERLSKQVAVANDLLARLRESVPAGPPEGEDLQQPPRLLLSVHDGTPPLRTELPFAVTTVLTRARGEPAIGHELSREIATSESIDALASFVTVSGVRALREPLEQHAAAGRKLRLLTTTYTGATEAEAIESLARLPNVQVRISYDARRTRLHAKAWLFSRPSGLDTAYVGSANLSSSALFHGHEWMVKVSAADRPSAIAKFRGTFETLWNDPEFEPFDPSVEEHRSRLRGALSAERGGGRRDAPSNTTFFNLAPYPFQPEILDRLQEERELHVAAAHESIRSCYGRPRVHAELRSQGYRIGRKRVVRLMRHKGRWARPTRQFKSTTLSGHSLTGAPNVLDREFDQPASNSAWGADIAYNATGQGWLYLVAILDLLSRDVARTALFEYPKESYSHDQRHSRLDYVSPAAFERLASRGPVAE